MIHYRMLGVSIAESWFLPEEQVPPTDLYYVQQADQVPQGFDVASPYTTLVVDLTQDEDTLLADMHKKTRYKINRAGSQDAITYTVDEECDLERFAEVFRSHEQFRKVVTLNMQRLRQYKEQNMLLLSYVTAPQVPMPLSAHCFLRFPQIVRPLYASILRPQGRRDTEFANFVGRANCHHFWMDMLHCKRACIPAFDCGGWYQGRNRELLAVARFKQGFGGTPRHQFACVQVRSLKGRLYMLLKRIYFACRGKPL